MCEFTLQIALQNSNNRPSQKHEKPTRGKLSFENMMLKILCKIWFYPWIKSTDKVTLSMDKVTLSMDKITLSMGKITLSIDKITLSMDKEYQ